MISVFDWDQHRGREEGVSERCFSANGFITKMFYESRRSKIIWKLTPLSLLENWKVSDVGISYVSNSGISIKMYAVSYVNREVFSWSQLLYSSIDKGMVILFLRKNDRTTEVFISVNTEFGISGV